MVAMRLSEAVQKMTLGTAGTEAERAVYRGAVVYYLWAEFGDKLQQIIDADGVEAPFYDAFANTYRFFLGAPGISAPEPAHLFAHLYQARRIWHFASTRIFGASQLVEATRAALWRVGVGSDPVAYAAGLYRRMHKVPVLITGETGTGKELAAQCIGWSRYIPFDEKARRFASKYGADYHVRNVREVPRELFASALFGHKRGSFTGAQADRTGFFGLPGEHGTLVLDEIGELPEDAQVMLLRPLQGREYVVVGGMTPIKMLGQHVFVTNRDLEAMCARGQFREDLLERMNGLRVHTPSALQIFSQAPGEIAVYVAGFAEEIAGDPARVPEWTERIVRSIVETLPGYTWPRNLRELRNYTERYILTDGHMPAPRASAPEAERGADGDDEDAPLGQRAPETRCNPSSGLLGPAAKAGKATLKEVTRDLVTRVYFQTGENGKATAEILDMNWRTVMAKIDDERLQRLRAEGRPEPDDED
jgi:two-component system, NtrC family, response regulator AtoC